jgi:anti-sigma factor RsiW
MTDCPNAEIRDLIPDLVHGTLAGAERQRVEQHIASCAECAAEAALIRRARTVLAPRTPSIDAGRIAARIPRYAPRSRGRLGTAWRVAASILVLAVGATTFDLVRRQSGQVAGDPTLGESAVATVADVGTLSFAGRLSALADEELEQLLADIDQLDTRMPAEPVRVLPVPPYEGRIP